MKTLWILSTRCLLAKHDECSPDKPIVQETATSTKAIRGRQRCSCTCHGQLTLF